MPEWRLKGDSGTGKGGCVTGTDPGFLWHMLQTR